MTRETKNILKYVGVFSLLLFAFGILLSMLFKTLVTGVMDESYLTLTGIELWIWNLVAVAILYWASWRISGKLKKLVYWKLALAVVGIMVVIYHLNYSYELINYYLIQGPPEQDQNALEGLLSLMEGSSLWRPRYDPGFYFFNALIDLKYFLNSKQYGLLFYNLLFGNLTMPLWVSAVTYAFRRKQHSANKT